MRTGRAGTRRADTGERHMTEPRSRQRAVDVGEPKAQPTKEMKTLAREVYDANKDKNAKGRVESAAKKELTKLMARVKGLIEFVIKVGGKSVRTTYVPGKSESIDGAALLKMVGADEVDRVIGIAKFSIKDVQETFGSNVAAACTDIEDTDYKLSVKEIK